MPEDTGYGFGRELYEESQSRAGIEQAVKDLQAREATATRERVGSAVARPFRAVGNFFAGLSGHEGAGELTGPPVPDRTYEDPASRIAPPGASGPAPTGGRKILTEDQQLRADAYKKRREAMALTPPASSDGDEGGAPFYEPGHGDPPYRGGEDQGYAVPPRRGDDYGTVPESLKGRTPWLAPSVEWGGDRRYPGAGPSAERIAVDERARQGIEGRHASRVADINEEAAANDPMLKAINAAKLGADYRELAPVGRGLYTHQGEGGKTIPGPFTQTGEDSFQTTPGFSDLTAGEARGIATAPNRLKAEAMEPVLQLAREINEAKARGADPKDITRLEAALAMEKEIAMLNITGIVGRNVGYYTGQKEDELSGALEDMKQDEKKQEQEKAKGAPPR